MPQHGFFDKGTQKWFCGYFMNKEEWVDIHDYSPENLDAVNDQTNKTDELNLIDKH